MSSELFFKYKNLFLIFSLIFLIIGLSFIIFNNFGNESNNLNIDFKFNSNNVEMNKDSNKNVEYSNENKIIELKNIHNNEDNDDNRNNVDKNSNDNNDLEPVNNDYGNSGVQKIVDYNSGSEINEDKNNSEFNEDISNSSSNIIIPENSNISNDSNISNNSSDINYENNETQDYNESDNFNNSTEFNNSENYNNSNNFKILYMKGEFATNTMDNITWLNNFAMIESGDISISNKLNNKIDSNIFVYGYDWMPADYHYTDGGSDGEFMKWILEDKYNRSLNPDGPFPHCEDHYDWCEDYYYNFGNDEVLSKRVDYVKTNILENNYSGVFFDWAAFHLLDNEEYSSFEDDWESKYNFTYISRVEEYYKKLKENNVKIFTNQAFRKDEYLLPYVDYDMTESYITDNYRSSNEIILENNSVEKLKLTRYFSLRVNEFDSDETDDTLFMDTMYYLDLLQKKKKTYVKNPNFKYVYMNYASTAYEINNSKYKKIQPKNAIYYNYALAKLVNELEYTEIPDDRYFEISDIYFYDLGSPLGNYYFNYSNMENNRIYVRYYNNSIIIAGFIKNNQTIHLNSEYIRSYSNIYDVYNSKWLFTNNSTLDLNISPYYDPALEKYVPFGRILVYGN